MKTPPTISLPHGVRDILPGEARSIARLERAILEVFDNYDFQRVMTPLLEYVDILSLGMGQELKDKVFKFMDPASGRVVAIRPDITPQIARLVATRMRDMALPLKLYYRENVLRYQERGKGGPAEILQIGAEYISEAPTPAIDAEIITIAIEALKNAGIKDFRVDIGDVGFVRKILDGLDVDANERKLIKDAVAKKDNSGLENLLSTLDNKVSSEDKDMLLSLTTLYGEAEVIDKATKIAARAGASDNLTYLTEVLSIINKNGLQEFITIDLGEVRGFDYYTGIIFEGFSCNVGKPILSGGRYDNLTGSYGFKASATGFAFNVDNIVSAI
jgi:ATP phosphoribosyltransferase regulatory subunit